MELRIKRLEDEWGGNNKVRERRMKKNGARGGGGQETIEKKDYLTLPAVVA
jgi:hypothetical protein